MGLSASMPASSVGSNRREKLRAPWAQPSSHPTVPHPTLLWGHLGSPPHQHNQAPTRLHPSGSFHIGWMLPEVPFSGKAAAFCHGTVGKEPE